MRFLKNRKFHILLFIMICSVDYVVAQTDTLDLNFGAIVFMDSVTVTASRDGFNKNDFIDIIQKDSSLLRAFRNYRFVSFNSNCHMEFFRSTGKGIAQFDQKAYQKIEGNCRQTIIQEEQTAGKIYKSNGDFKYLTLTMYDRLFQNRKRKCDDPNRPIMVEIDPKNIYQYQVNELKKLIFAPGSKSDLPLLGNMTEIFSKEMSPYYHYQVEHASFENEPCYVFTASIHPSFINENDKTIIKYLRTYFKKENFQVIAREYHIQQSQLFYQFDVSMKIKVDKIDEKYLPTEINYKGFWKVPFKKEERCKFKLEFSDYLIPEN